MNTVYLVCFFLGIALSLLAAFSGLGARLHLGHMGGHTGGHFGHHAGAATHAGHGAHGAAKPSPGSSPPSWINGFTLPAFLCWFGGAGYLLDNYTPWLTPLVLLLAVALGLTGASLVYVCFLRFLLVRERVLRPEDTRMEGTVARISSQVRGADGIGEILFTQLGARKSSPARSEDGQPIPRGTEVVVLRYDRGVAWVRPLYELSGEGPDSPLSLNP